jgi:hypothetical protein
MVKFISAYQMSSVNAKAVSVLTDGLKVNVDSSLHITATASLEGIQRQFGLNALSIATFLDLAIFSSEAVSEPISLSLFPQAKLSHIEYGEQKKGWRNHVKHMKMSQPVLDGVTVRELAVQTDMDDSARRLFLRSSKTVLKSLSWACSAGFSPEDFRPNDDFEKSLKEIWTKAESKIFAAKVRELLWSEDASTKLNLKGILSHLTGSKSQSFDVFLHGFYFYTPIQWKLFHVLNAIPGVNVHAIVHDDGEGESYRIWREFFTERFGFRFPGKVRGTENRQSPALIFLNDVLGNRRPDFVPAGVDIIECNSPAEFARDYFQLFDEVKSQTDVSTALFAADEKSISKYLHRIGKDQTSVDTNLLQMPVGAFLVALHNCLVRNSRGELALRLSINEMATMLSSGFVPALAADSAGAELSEKISEVIQFYQGCEDPIDWKSRSSNHERLILSELAAFPQGIDRHPVLQRNMEVVENPLLLLPWANLSHHQVSLLREGIHEVVDLAEKILESASLEGTTIHRHISNLVRELAYGLQNLSENDRALIEQKFNVTGLDNEMAMDVDALVEIVDLILQRKTEFAIDELGEDGDDDESMALPLRALDVCGFDKTPRPIVIANLSDQAFPQQPANWPWPFTQDNLSHASNLDSTVSTAEIIKTRARTASMADVYLLSLAFGVANNEHRVRLSWISDVAGIKQELSPIIRLLAAPSQNTPTPLRDCLIGVPISQSLSAAEIESAHVVIADELAAVTEFETQSKLDGFGLVPSSSIHLCERRFALQWAFGQPQFVAEHMQANLHGHLYGWLQVVRRVGAQNALRTVEDFWRHLSSVLRAGSRAMNFIRWKGARPNWIFFGKGNKSGDSSFDRAYQHALGIRKPFENVWSNTNFQFLPQGSAETDACQLCPINKTCSLRIIK